MKKSNDLICEHSKLKKIVSEYFRCISGVPMRAVDCDQELEERLFKKIAKMVNYRLY